MPKTVTDESFEQDVLKSDKPVLVDFWAEWCGPCRAIAPILDEIDREMKDRVVVAKLNIDENPKMTGMFGVRAIPTLMLFKDGQVAATKIGEGAKSRLVAWIESVI